MDQNLMKNLLAIKKASLDVKFDLADTDYIPVENIGAGAYGVVCSATNKRTRKKVAIKKIPNVFDVETTAKRTYREIKILRHFKHENIIHIQEILKPSTTFDKFKDIYVVLDLMESDLHRIIHSNQPLTQEHCRFFLYQLLRGLKYMHSAKVIHRDLKPSNLLVNENCDLKIGDFGMARGLANYQDENMISMTQYVATRWYRAPELIMSFIDYTTAVDVWSVGCIFAEMINRKALFPGRNGIVQLQLIIGTLGTPSDEVLQQSRSEIVKGIVQSIGAKTALSWNGLFPSATRKVIDLISRMLVVDPLKRITVDEALSHPFLSKYHDPDDEPTSTPFDFSFEKTHMDLSQLRKAIFKEILDSTGPVQLKPVPKKHTENISASERDKTYSNNQVHNDYSSKTICVQDGIQPSSQVINKKLEIGRKVQYPANIPDDLFKNINIDTSALTSSSVDVEMLSAKSNNNELLYSDGVVEMLSAKLEESHLDGFSEKQSSTVKDIDKVSSSIPSIESKNYLSSTFSRNLATDVKPQEQKRTVSEDTKALIKAALLQSSLKKMEQGNQLNVSRPITAAQRQRERDDKRKRKREKAHEKKKKLKEKGKLVAAVLTVEDRNLLERWKNMAGRTTSGAPIIPSEDETDRISSLSFKNKTTITGNDVIGDFTQCSSTEHLITHPASTIGLISNSVDSNVQNAATVEPADEFQKYNTFPMPVHLSENTRSETTVIPSLDKSPLAPMQSLLCNQTFECNIQNPHGNELPQVNEEIDESFNTLFDTNLFLNQRINNVNVTDTTVTGVNDFPVDTIPVDEKLIVGTGKDDLMATSLALTPKGSGEGYGVGIDLDEILTSLFTNHPLDNKDNSKSCSSGTLDSAPLSASLLADWKDVTESIDVKDLEVLQQELTLTSPIVLPE